jgi:hypothetical protein
MSSNARVATKRATNTKYRTYRLVQCLSMALDTKQQKVGIRIVHLDNKVQCQELFLHNASLLQESSNILFQKSDVIKGIQGHLTRQRINIVRGLYVIHQLNDIWCSQRKSTSNPGQTKGLGECLQDDNVGVLVNQGNGRPLVGKVNVGFIDNHNSVVGRARRDLFHVREWNGLARGIAWAADEEQLGAFVGEIQRLLGCRDVR